ncbi:MAG: TIGR04255 family protein [Caldilineales bacterium]|nr:TIGR04255 family protein [Caldilineales bacterium]
MSRYYQNSPIVEAVCEFRFAPGQPWDWTVPGLVYDRLKDEFPKKRQQNALQLQLRAEDQEIAQSIKGGVALMQFLRADESALIQVGPDLLTVNHAQPYSNWQTFRGMIERALDTYQNIVKPQGITRIGLRYINRIEIPEHQVTIEDYLLATPRAPQTISQIFAAWAQRIEMPLPQVNGILVLQSGSLPDPQQKKVIFLLDLDLFTAPSSEHLPINLASDWIERAHTEIEQAFEACITDKTRPLFREVITHDE